MNLDDWWLNAFWSVVPTLCLGLIFWFIIRAIMRADRSERKAYAKVEAEERARFERERAAAGSSSEGPRPESPSPVGDPGAVRRRRSGD